MTGAAIRCHAGPGRVRDTVAPPLTVPSVFNDPPSSMTKPPLPALLVRAPETLWLERWLVWLGNVYGCWVGSYHVNLFNYIPNF